MTPAEALVRALEQEAAERCWQGDRMFVDPVNAQAACQCRPCSARRTVASFRAWLTNEAVETVARAMWNHDDGRKNPWPWEDTTDLERTPHRGRAGAALRAIFGELAP